MSPDDSRNVPAIEPGAISVLHVEDVDDHAVLMGAAMKRGLSPRPEVVRANCLEEAIAVLKERSFDIVLLDLGLPESQGLDTLNLLLQRFEYSLPVVVLTANADEEVGEQAVASGALDYLIKGDTNAVGMRRAIRYALERWKLKKAVDQSKRDIESFAYMAAHDLKAPLRTISSFCAIIPMEFEATQDIDKVREDLEVLGKSAARAGELVSDLLKFAKLGESGVALDTGSLTELARDVVSSLKQGIEDVGGSVEIAEPLLDACFDAGLVRHVLQNLISNGLKFSGENVPMIRIATERVNDGVVVSVTDNGMGIEAEYVEKIFAPFQRLVSADTIEGSGLGLAICQRIVEAHNGRIWVESEVGKGSVFRFSLPS